ncbi:hypothetical protein C8R44DRAFT_754048 [Mycena epipterygia]|nr:hypothetical protein C8R44DRAFT_754048 [Mycena epipterygia]
MWIPLLSAILAWSLVLVNAAQTNYTIDDSSPIVEYRAALWAQSTEGFNISELYNGTVTFVHEDPNGTPTIAMNFSGTALYIFVAYPSGKAATVPIGFVARIDDFPAGEWTADELAPLHNQLAYSNNTLPNGPHTVLLQLCARCSLYFDYAIITSDTDPASSTSSPSSTLPQITSPPSVSTSGAKKKFPVGAVVGGILGGLAFIALVLTPLLLRRRAMTRKRPAPFFMGTNPSDEPAEKDGGAPPLTPFVLQAPSSARTRSDKSALSVRIPTAPSGSRMEDYVQSPTSAASDVALTRIAEDMRRITVSVQRLETGIPEARDGGSALLRPPAYGNSD